MGYGFVRRAGKNLSVPQRGRFRFFLPAFLASLQNPGEKRRFHAGAVLVALLYFWCAPVSGAEYFRAFSDGQGHFITVRGNTIAWGDEKKFQMLPTERFQVAGQDLHFTFEDARLVNGGAKFDSTAGQALLSCGPKSRTYSLLADNAAQALRGRLRFGTAAAPAKPVLLGILGGTQLFIYLEATMFGQNHPRFQLYFGPVRQLKALPTSTNAGSRETVVTAHDLKIVIAPGSHGSGVLIHYKNKTYPLDYLRNTTDNLFAVMGEAQYKKQFAQREKTLCDTVLGD